MDYIEPVFRPPSEAYSILLQITVGCSHNKCRFCEMYKTKRFFIKSDETIMADIEEAARDYSYVKKLFLCDGDALIVPQKRLVRILEAIKEKMPWIERIGTYANTKSIKMKSVEDLKELRRLGLKIAYMGLESGDDVILEQMNKGADTRKMIDMAKKIKEAGIKLSVTVLNGLGSRERSKIHAIKTGEVLSEMKPDFVGALSFMITPGTPLYREEFSRGEFKILKPEELLEEIGLMIANTDMDGLFHANHASNYLPIRARLPEDRDKTLKLIHDALDGKVKLKPEHMRAL
ncbi:MAG: radical SAM protein [Deltaproteobacteria bacterium]|nr:MAG: radical SAM protein [Deltaproteobacteria bacterium]